MPRIDLRGINFLPDSGVASAIGSCESNNRRMKDYE